MAALLGLGVQIDWHASASVSDTRDRRNCSVPQMVPRPQAAEAIAVAKQSLGHLAFTASPTENWHSSCRTPSVKTAALATVAVGMHALILVSMLHDAWLALPAASFALVVGFVVLATCCDRRRSLMGQLAWAALLVGLCAAAWGLVFFLVSGMHPLTTVLQLAPLAVPLGVFSAATMALVVTI